MRRLRTSTCSWAVRSSTNSVTRVSNVSRCLICSFGTYPPAVLVEVVIGDTTSLRNRLFFSYIPAMPFVRQTHLILPP
jgi:hypothetical protein